MSPAPPTCEALLVVLSTTMGMDACPPYGLSGIVRRWPPGFLHGRYQHAIPAIYCADARHAIRHDSDPRIGYTAPKEHGSIALDLFLKNISTFRGSGSPRTLSYSRSSA